MVHQIEKGTQVINFRSLLGELMSNLPPSLTELLTVRQLITLFLGKLSSISSLKPMEMLLELTLVEFLKLSQIQPLNTTEMSNPKQLKFFLTVSSTSESPIVILVLPVEKESVHSQSA